MKNWMGIRQDSDWTANDGAFYAANTSYDMLGEIQRRPGMLAFAQQSGVVMAPFWSPSASYQMAYATSDGQLVVLEVS